MVFKTHCFPATENYIKQVEAPRRYVSEDNTRKGFREVKGPLPSRYRHKIKFLSSQLFIICLIFKVLSSKPHGHTHKIASREEDIDLDLVLEGYP